MQIVTVNLSTIFPSPLISAQGAACPIPLLSPAVEQTTDDQTWFTVVSPVQDRVNLTQRLPPSHFLRTWSSQISMFAPHWTLVKM